MTGWDPTGARPRADLPWIRRRSLRATSAPGRSRAVPPAVAPPATRAAPAPVSVAAAPPASAGLLDLFPDEPAVDPAPRATPASGPTGPAPHPPRRTAASGTRSSPAGRPPPRVGPTGRVILTTREPTVTLNRVQSGVGALTVEAACSPAVGDIRIGALYQLTDGSSAIVQHATAFRTAPHGSRRPVLVTARGQFDQLVVDLRQSRAVQRLLVYAVSESGAELHWGGTLVTRTYGGARVEIPLDIGRHRGPVALLSLYNIDGEHVLRAENEKIAGSVRDVALSFGYDRITWADQHIPVV